MMVYFVIVNVLLRQYKYSTYIEIINMAIA